MYCEHTDNCVPPVGESQSLEAANQRSCEDPAEHQDAAKRGRPTPVQLRSDEEQHEATKHRGDRKAWREHEEYSDRAVHAMTAMTRAPVIRHGFAITR